MVVAPRLFTIPPSQDFLAVLARAIVDGGLVPGLIPRADPLALADLTIYLPTRRAARRLREALLDALGTGGAILPRIRALGEADDDPLAFADDPGAAPDLPEAVDPRTRRLVLARLVAAFAAAAAPRHDDGRRIAAGPAQALALADDLATLIDDMATRLVPWTALDDLVPDRYDAYWQMTLAFLRIARDTWPAWLAEQGLTDPSLRRDALIAAEAVRLAARPERPVIAAGSTGSMPATAAFLTVIARLPRGAVVLPGFDTTLDDASRAALAGTAGDDLPAATHPQVAMQALVARLGVPPDAVTLLAQPDPDGRDTLLTETMRPSATAHLWGGRRPDPDMALRDFALVEAATPHEEALAAALALREAVDVPGRTAALVTPDRALARRVALELDRWSVPVDDSGGQPLADHPAGTFARLLAEAQAEAFAPVPLLALLKHPLARFGRSPAELADAVGHLELAILRGPRPAPGLDGLARALQAHIATRGDLYRTDPRHRQSDADLAAATTLVASLTAAMPALPTGPLPLSTRLAAHREALAAAGDAFAGEDGEALADLFAHYETAATDMLVAANDYADVFAVLAAAVTVRRPGAPGARVRILGPLEARLQRFDRVVLAGLNEGIWPPQPSTDAWLSRPMRHALGLDLPERRVGLSAHDFVQLAGTRDLVLTRALKQDGVPRIASRFLQRLTTVAGSEAAAAMTRRGLRYLALARHLDRPAGAPKPATRPAPCPPVHLRPDRLSVTEIETLIRDPYAIHARHVLKLQPLDPVDADTTAADRGSLFHEILDQATRDAGMASAAIFHAALIAAGEQAFKAFADRPEARAVWWPRFLRIADWVTVWHTSRVDRLTTILTEQRARLPVLTGPDRTVTLSGQADRLERGIDGGWTLIDFKTGTPPGPDEVKVGLAPQLPLEAALLTLGGFDGVPKGAAVSGLAYVKLSGAAVAGVEKVIGPPDGKTLDDLALETWTKLAGLLARYEDAAMPYRSRLIPKMQRFAGTYDHLARVAEWASGSDGEDA
jgi:ATP-dependent helicase/nuclease subunit B